MKKIIVLFSLGLFCLSTIARDLGSTWIVTNEGKMDCKRINLGYKKARVVLENGQKTAISYNAISSYSQNGKIFNKLHLYIDGKPANKMTYMELIKTHGDLSLYKLGFLDLGSSNLRDITYRYFLYNGGKLHLALNEKTLQNVCLHFGLNYDEL
jgi:hypothetical protein